VRIHLQSVANQVIVRPRRSCYLGELEESYRQLICRAVEHLGNRMRWVVVRIGRSTLRRTRNYLGHLGEGEDDEDKHNNDKLTDEGQRPAKQLLQDSPSPTSIGEIQAPGLVSPWRRGGFHIGV
jgi:hypothetical protein